MKLLLGVSLISSVNGWLELGKSDLVWYGYVLGIVVFVVGSLLLLSFNDDIKKDNNE